MACPSVQPGSLGNRGPAMTLGPPVVREAVPADAGELHRLVKELARYERAPDAVQATTGDIADALFGPHPVALALVAEVDRRVVGMAVYFMSFSTWTGRAGLYLEDLYVEPEYRSRGLGRALLAALAARAVQQGCSRLEWAVLDWNEPAIGFYRSLGAVAMDEWTTYRLSGPALAELGRSVSVLAAGDGEAGPEPDHDEATRPADHRQPPR